MADNILTRATDDKNKSLTYAEAIQLLKRAQEEAPGLYEDFKKALVSRGRSLNNLINNGFNDFVFEEELRIFSRRFAEFLRNQQTQEGLSDAGRLDVAAHQLEPSLIPKEVVEASLDIASDKETFRALYRKQFTKRLVDNFVNQLRTEQRTAALSDELEKEVSGALNRSNTETDFSRELLSQISQKQGTEIASAAQGYLSRGRALEEAHAEYSGAIYDTYRRAVVEAPVNDIATYASVLRNEIINHPLESVDAATTRATEQTKILEVFGADAVPNIVNDIETKKALDQFVRSFSDAGVKKTLAPLADVAISLLGPDTQFEVKRILTGEAFKKTLEDTKFLEKHFNGPAPGYISEIRSATLTPSAIDQLKTHERSLSPQGKVALWMGRLFIGPNEAILDSITALNASSVDGKTVFESLRNRHNLPLAKLPTTMHAGSILHHATLMHEALFRFWLQSGDGVWAFVHSRGPFVTHITHQFNNVAGWFLRFGAGRAGGAATKALASWGIKTFLGKTAGALLGFVAFGPVGAFLAGLIGNIALGKVFGGIKRLFGGGGGKRKWHEDPSSWQFVALLVGAPIIIILFLSFQTMSMLSGAFFVTSPRNIGGGLPGSTIIKYTGQTPAPAPLSTAPVTGRLSQGPFKPGTTHEHADAVDIPKNPGDPIVFAQDCLIVSNGTENGCLWDTNLGNYVRCAGNCGGQQCFTTYAHLSSCSNAVINAIPGDTNQALPATLMKTGTVLGFIGSTGNSTGAHLHFQYNGPGSLTDYFPSIANGSL